MNKQDREELTKYRADMKAETEKNRREEQENVRREWAQRNATETIAATTRTGISNLTARHPPPGGPTPPPGAKMQTAKINALFDKVIAEKRLKNDAALSRFLKVAPPVISKMRHGHLNAGPAMILSLHENADMAVADIRRALGDEVVS